MFINLLSSLLNSVLPRMNLVLDVYLCNAIETIALSYFEDPFGFESG